MKTPLHIKTALFCCFIFIANFANAQTGSIKGRVTSSDGKPADYISVAIVGQPQGTTTNENGDYRINRVKTGTYTIKVSAVGLSSQEKSVTVSEQETATVDFVLSENNQRLQDVVVRGIRNKYKSDQPSQSLRLNEPLLEIPQNIQIVTSQALSDQQVISMSDGLIRNVSGAVRLEHWGDMYTNISMRGTQIQAFRNGMNVVNSYWGPLTEDMSFIDHIEFVKGPAGFMLANGDPSGLYNVVTKKPTGISRGEATLTLGSFDLYRAAVDLDGKLSKDGKLLYRLNVAGQNKNSFRPYEYNNRYSVAPVISYQLDEKTKITAEYTYQNAKMSDVGSFYVFGTDGYASLPRDFTLLQPGLAPTKINDHSTFLNLEHKLNSNWKLTTQLAYFNYTMGGSSMWPTDVTSDGKIIRGVGIWDAKSEMTLGQAFLNGNVTTGKVQHRILVGLDVGTKAYMADWSQSHSLDSVGGEFDPLNPNYGFPVNGYPSFDRTLNLEARSIAAGGNINQRYSGLYFQDELGFFENKLRITLAGRYSEVSQSAWGGSPDKANRFTPRLGASVSIDKQTSVYGLYDQAFIPQSGRLESGSKVKPITGNNTEFGIKKDWFDGKWNTTLAAYRIIKKNELTASPTAPPNSGLSVVIGESRFQGIEFDLRGEILRGLNLTANYAYTDAEVSKVTPGVNVISVGDRIVGSAKHIVNSWLSYKAQNGALKGTGISGGFTYLVDRATGSYSSSAPAQNLPDYFKLDGGLFWEGDKMRITANAFNILDKYLYTGAYYSDYFSNAAYSWQAEAPRNYRLSIAYKF